MRLHVKNFGPIREAEVEIRPMTVFVGHSNTGKSYLAMLVYAVAQALANSNNRDKESFLDSFGGNPTLKHNLLFIPSKRESLEDDIDSGERFFNENSVRSIIDGVLAVYLRNISQVWDYKAPFYFDIERAHFSLLIIDETNKINMELSPGSIVKKPDVFVKEITEKMETRVKEILEEQRAEASKRKLKEKVSISSLISDIALTKIYDKKSPLNVFDIIIDSLAFPSFHIDDYSDERAQNKFHYLPAGRGVIMESHLSIANAIVHNAAPAHSNNLPFNGVPADFFQKLLSVKDLLNISDEGKKIAIFADKMEKRITKGRIKLKISETGSPHFNYTLENVNQGDIPLIKASSAVSELASIILFIRYYLSKGDIFIIEEPEANLHTAAQREIAALLVELVNADVHVLITTHSDVIIEQISNCMQASRLPEDSETKVLHNAILAPEKINAYTFVENNDGTEVQLISPDEEDLDILSEDHTDVSSDLYNESVRIYNATHKNGN